MRRRRVKFAIWILGAGWLFGLVPEPACACSCVENPPPLAALQESDAVFTGFVLSVEELNRGLLRSSADRVEVTFRVTEAWKGVDSDRVKLRTAAAEASCGFEFVVGMPYIVYAYETANGLSTGLCTRTTDLALAADDLAALGKGMVPPPSPELEASIRSNPAGMWLFWGGTAFAVLSAAALAMMLLRLGRRR